MGNFGKKGEGKQFVILKNRNLINKKNSKLKIYYAPLWRYQIDSSCFVCVCGVGGGWLFGYANNICIGFYFQICVIAVNNLIHNCHHHNQCLCQWRSQSSFAARVNNLFIVFRMWKCHRHIFLSSSLNSSSWPASSKCIRIDEVIKSWNYSLGI